MEILYSVEEEHSDDRLVSEFFNTRREDALLYLKQQAAIFDGVYKEWQKEKGINCYKWNNGKEYVKLYLEMLEVDGE